MSTAVLSRPIQAPPVTETPWPLDVLGAPEIAFVVYGDPAPQGSKTARPIYKGRGPSKQFTGKVAMTESSKKVDPWRKAVAAVASRLTIGGTIPGWELLDGPLIADMVFTLHKGTTLPKHLDWHERYPDLSKLARSTEDALSKIVWTDDARVSDYRRLAKRFVGSDDPDALPQPGAVVRVWRVPDHLQEERRARVLRPAGQGMLL